jgi:hypothetical protein
MSSPASSAARGNRAAGVLLGRACGDVLRLPYANPAFVVDQAARMVATRRDEGRTVLLHCAAGQSRSPAVAIRYTMLRTGDDGGVALDEMRRLLSQHGYRNNDQLRRVVERFG